MTVAEPQAHGHSSLLSLSNTPRHRCSFSLYGEKGWGPPRQERAPSLQLRENRMTRNSEAETVNGHFQEKLF